LTEPQTLFIALAILVTLFIAALALWVGAKVATTEKRLLYRPRRLYASGDADFRRALGILLGPPLVGGNRVTTLINGDRIFPPMLEAIRSATVSITFHRARTRTDRLHRGGHRKVATHGVAKVGAPIEHPAGV
jgi:cardiolipin synthase A/B